MYRGLNRFDERNYQFLLLNAGDRLSNREISCRSVKKIFLDLVKYLVCDIIIDRFLVKKMSNLSFGCLLNVRWSFVSWLNSFVRSKNLKSPYQNTCYSFLVWETCCPVKIPRKVFTSPNYRKFKIYSLILSFESCSICLKKKKNKLILKIFLNGKLK